MADNSMMDPEAAGGGRAVAAGGFGRSLYEIFADPGKVFARIDAGLQWWKAFIVAAAVMIGVGWVMTPFRNQALMPMLRNLSPEQMERAQAQMKTWGPVGLLMAPILMIVALLIVGAIAHVAINIMSSRANFKKTLSLLSFCSLISLVEQIVVTAVIAGRGVESVESMADLKMSIGPAALLPDAAGALEALLQSFSLFQIWYYVVLVLGVAAVFRLRRPQAVIAVAPVWLISFLLLLVGGKFQGGMR